MLKLVLVLFVIFTVNCSLSGAIIRARESFLSARQIGQSMAQCFGQNQIINCLENIISDTLDTAIASNETWHLSDIFVIEKNLNTTPSSFIHPSNKKYYDKLQNLSTGRSLSDTLAMKILQLAQMRSIKLQLPSSVNKLLQERSISSAVGDFNADDNDGENNEDDSDSQLEQEEGRKKKDKDKNMALMGGMAMLAMVAQMFLGKVILIAGAAFVMAKLALLVSVLGSVKKGHHSGSGGGGGGTEHVIVTGGGGGGGSHSHEYSSGWHRSLPYYSNKYVIPPTDEHKFTEPLSHYEAEENDAFKRRNQINQHQPPTKQNNLNKIKF